MSAQFSELLREAEYRNPGHMLYGHAAEVVDELCEALEKAAKRFREYQELHLAKGTVDGALKAATNRIAAEQCEAALAKARGEHE